MLPFSHKVIKMQYLTVGRIYILSVFIVGFINSANEIERVKQRIKYLESRLNFESTFRDEDIAEITERLDDIERILNSTIEQKHHSFPLKTITSNLDLVTVDKLKEDFTRIRTAFRQEKYETERFRREIPKIESDLISINEDVENYCKVALNKTDMLLSYFEQLEHFIKDSDSASKHERDILQHITEQVKINTENENNMSKQIENLENLVWHINDLYVSSCLQAKNMGNSVSGIYKIKHGPKVFCDQTTDGGGWIVFQRRMNGNIDFYRNWTEYKRGFGDLNGEFWLGNDHLVLLTLDGKRELRIDIEDFEGNSAYAKYSTFKIHSEENNYKLEVNGYSGTAGDALEYHNEMMFSTFDNDNDKSSDNCASKWHGAWWYRRSHLSHLNGRYYNKPGTLNFSGIIWYQWKTNYYSLKNVEIKFR